MVLQATTSSEGMALTPKGTQLPASRPTPKRLSPGDPHLAFPLMQVQV